MVDIEGSPEYRNKHPNTIHLDTYRGVACDLMELNAPVADGFMRVSDIRDDVVIIRKPQERARDYEIGSVIVAKMLKMPRLDFWRGNHTTQTRREDGVWYLAINDQELADRVARDEVTNGKKFDRRFVGAFQTEVNIGLTTILKREKLLNSGKYSTAFLIGYYSLLSYDLVFFPVITAAIALGGTSKPLEVGAMLASLVAGVHTIHNALHLVNAGFSYIQDRLSTRPIPELSFHPRTRFNDPFVRHSIPEFLMPAVPVDRLVRGLYYLSKHGDKIIRPHQNEQSKSYP